MATTTLEQVESSVAADTSPDANAVANCDSPWLPEIDDALASLRGSTAAIADLVDEVFDDFELLGSELTLRSQIIAELKTQLAERSESLRLLERAEAELRVELAAAERELAEAEPQLTDLPLQVRQLKEQLHGIELERCSLEVELESLRVRAAELTDQLVELKREGAEERAEWSSELKQLRRSLDRQSELFIDRMSVHSRGHTDAPTVSAPTGVAGTALGKDTPPPCAAQAATNDAVLGSVISQFEALQKDRQRRRGT
jgi:hypothetical protein